MHNRKRQYNVGTFCSQVRCEQVSKLTVKGASLHAGGRQVPGVRVGLVGVGHGAIVDVQGVCVHEQAGDAVGGRVDGLGSGKHLGSFTATLTPSAFCTNPP